MLPHKIIVKIARTNICEENFEALELLVIAHKCGPKVDVANLKSVKKVSKKLSLCCCWVWTQGRCYEFKKC